MWTVGRKVTCGTYECIVGMWGERCSELSPSLRRELEQKGGCDKIVPLLLEGGWECPCVCRC